MNHDGEHRRLSAILIADIAGYTRLVEHDTDGTVAAWKAARDDVINDGKDIHGEGVNIAARIEGLAEPAPDFIGSAFRGENQLYVKAEHMDMLLDGLRKAGFP